MAIVQRLINIQFQPTTVALGATQTGTAGLNLNATISGLRTSVHVTVAARTGIASAMATANVRIFGMLQSQMNNLSTLGMQVRKIQDRSSITIFAGDIVNGMYQIYKGQVTNAWSDYQAAPQVPFNVESQAGISAATMSVPPTSINSKSADVAGMIQNLAQQAGLNFTNNGVNTKIAYPYWWGSPRDQILAIVNAANIEWSLDNDTVSIWPQNGYRSTQGLTLSPGSGLVGYPSFVNGGVAATTLFTPNLNYGTQVTIVGSSITQANGVWKVYSMEHFLDSMLPNGKWFTRIILLNPKVVGTVAPALSASPSS